MLFAARAVALPVVEPAIGRVSKPYGHEDDEVVIPR